MKNLELAGYGLEEMNHDEMVETDGGNPQDKKIAGALLAVTGVTILAIAAGPVGWTLYVAGMAGMIME